MPILTNASDQTIKATTGHCIEPGKSLPVSAATLLRLTGERYIAIQMKKGYLIVSPDVVEAEEIGEVTRTAIAKATRAQLIDIILAAHPGADASDFDEIKVEGRDGLRAVATRLTFGEV